jgi:hypothetical protein
MNLGGSERRRELENPASAFCATNKDRHNTSASTLTRSREGVAQPVQKSSAQFDKIIPQFGQPWPPITSSEIVVAQICPPELEKLQ